MPITAKQILESIPHRFRPEKAVGFNTIFHFDITGEETLQYTVEIREQQCFLTRELKGNPSCTISAKASVYIDLETGKANPQMALMLGKVKVSNLAAMMQFAKCFRKFDINMNYAGATASGTTANIVFQTSPVKTGPLVGLKIVDFTRLLPGPLATMFLADMGADVIKIEDPDNPDYVRDFEPRINGISLFYLSLNRNKRSMAVNYLSPEGKQIIYDLVKSADVLIEQFRPGVMKEMGFSYEELSMLNPKLIYVSVTGYGQNSSMAMAAGHDLNYIAIGGALGITGNADGQLTIPGFQLADIAGGSYMAMNAVLAALYQREKTGKGEWVDVAMTDAVVPFTALQFAHYQGTKQIPPAGQFELSGALPNYNIYACADGKFVALGSLEPKFWNKFCEKAGRNDWAERFLTDTETVKQEVKDFFRTKTRSEWLQFFEDSDICLTTVNSLADMETDIHLRERHMLLENEHSAVGKYRTINQPLKFKQTKFDNNQSAPDLGEDSASVLQELNYTTDAIQLLAHKGIVKLKTK